MREILGIAAIAASLIMLLALLTFDVNDPGWSHTGTGVRIENSIGRAGAWFADVFYYLLGYMAYLLPIILGVYGWNLFRDRKLTDEDYQPFAFVRLVGFIIVLASAAGLADLHFGVPEGALPHGTFGGGVIGTATAWKLVAIFKPLGTTLVLLPLFFCSLTLAIGSSWLNVIEAMGGWLQSAFARFTSHFDHWREVQAENQKRRSASEARQEGVKRRESILKRKKNRLDDSDGDPLMDADELVDDKPIPVLKKVVTPGPAAESEAVGAKAAGAARKAAAAAKKKLEITTRAKNEKQFTLFRDVPDSELPPLSLLDPPEQQKPGFSDEELEGLSRLLETKLADFNITVEVVAVHPGPVITRFELQPSPGVKARQITNLTQDIARSLSIVSVRVVEVIAGKSTIGLEIPNEEREIVQLSEMLQSEQYDDSASPLTLALGKNISGVPVTADLQRMPHLLVAGTTGSGKSVAVNSMLISLLYKATPREVRMILIDPKMLELNIYDGIPHLLTPVVTDMKEAANALRWCVGEMERRYKLMASLGVRNLAGFNKKVKEAEERGEPIVDPLYKAEESLNPTAAPPTLEPFPFIVVVVDEFADMMMQVGKKAEELIARIAQKARAAGIHLILATQRPSVDVITGLIKANIPTRIAFQVSSRIDSRTILDQMGAESLLGHGDMLYLPPGTALPERVHGAFVDDHEVHSVAAYIKQSGEPNYIEEILQESGPIPGLPGDKADPDSETDALYDQAVAVVTESRKASISYVQRRLKIGYNRAARMIEDMEAAGVVSQVQSNGTREVLAPPPIGA
ncbi:MAG: DNA translocase FtsK 4TM domain-containing protein [Granulosicoccus sp.]|nr:DNA translocase FtsK 4TM domain-containing protein [Granulosicoccus sp.]